MTTVLFGAAGQLGVELHRALAPLGPICALTRSDASLTDPDAIRAALRRTAPRLIVNAAAYTAVDAAERDAAQTYVVNAEAPGVMAEEAARLGAGFVHYSTDYVFDGRKAEPYIESDQPAPLNVYGASKLAGEERVRAAGARSLVLRVSWVYGARGRNFVRTMRARLREPGATLRVVDDQIGAPTPSGAIADATARIVTAWTGDGLETYHLTASGSTSWFGLVQAIIADDPAPWEHQFTSLDPVPSSAYATPARRPANSRLDCSKLSDAFGVSLRPWREYLGPTLHAMAALSR
jgi:dTDP-4-dehydrorhamnose reductase